MTKRGYIIDCIKFWQHSINHFCISEICVSFFFLCTAYGKKEEPICILVALNKPRCLPGIFIIPNCYKIRNKPFRYARWNVVKAINKWSIQNYYEVYWNKFFLNITITVCLTFSTNNDKLLRSFTIMIHTSRRFESIMM